MKPFKRNYIGYLLMLLIPVIIQGFGVWIFSGWCQLPVSAERQKFLYEHRGVLEPYNGDLLVTTLTKEVRGAVLD